MTHTRSHHVLCITAALCCKRVQCMPFIQAGMRVLGLAGTHPWKKSPSITALASPMAVPSAALGWLPLSDHHGVVMQLSSWLNRLLRRSGGWAGGGSFMVIVQKVIPGQVPRPITVQLLHTCASKQQCSAHDVVCARQLKRIAGFAYTHDVCLSTSV